jgi:hypothetical protein
MPGEEEEHRQPHRIAAHTNAGADARATRKRTPNGTDRAFRVAARICVFRSDGTWGCHRCTSSMILLRMPSKWFCLSRAVAFLYLPPPRRH